VESHFVDQSGRWERVQDETTLTSPPAGFDSVLGEVGKSLKYDEVVVYREDAMNPSYLVMYDK